MSDMELMTRRDAQQLRAEFRAMTEELVEVRALLDRGVTLLGSYDPNASDIVEAMTLEQIGQEMGLTRERIRQIEAKALRKLRERMPRFTGNEIRRA